MGKITINRILNPQPPSLVLLCMVQVETVVVRVAVTNMEDVVAGSMVDILRVMQSLKGALVSEEEEVVTVKEEVNKREVNP